MNNHVTPENNILLKNYGTYQKTTEFNIIGVPYDQSGIFLGPLKQIIIIGFFLGGGNGVFGSYLALPNLIPGFLLREYSWRHSEDYIQYWIEPESALYKAKALISVSLDPY